MIQRSPSTPRPSPARGIAEPAYQPRALALAVKGEGDA
jgi:hypothetical protein